MTDTSSRGGDTKGLQFLSITDFSPGIYDSSVISFGTAPNNVPGTFPAPPGAADVTNTFGCIAEPNGGLGPLPALGGTPGTSGLSLTDMGMSGIGEIDITAMINSMQTAQDELVIGITPAPVASSQTTHFNSYVVGTASLNSIQSASYTFSSGNKNFCAYPFTTTINHSGTQQPVVVLPLTAPAGPTSLLQVYPDPGSPSAFGTATITTNRPGSSFGHQGRIVGVQVNNAYGWPVSVTEFPNEAFDYTDPPLSTTWPVQFEIFGPENPFGYGAFNSVSAGELFGIKRRGGAIMIQGDLNNPTVTYLSAVKSTGELYGRSDNDQNGMYYCVKRQGAWVWNGGNSSTKVSGQLDDRFFEPANPISDTSYYGYYCQRWEDWMLFSNNWVFDSTKGGWWRLDDPSVKSFFWYIPSYAHRYMFAALPTVTGQAQKFLWQYDRSTPRNTFTWQSLPLKLPGTDRLSDVREVVLRASNPYGDVNPSIATTLIDSFGNSHVLDTWTVTAGEETVQETRLNANAKGESVAIVLTATGTTYAPVIHSVQLGVRTREHVSLS